MKIEIKSIGYTHDYGDLIGDYEKYIREFSEEELNGLNVLNLEYFSPNTWSSILNNEVFNIVQFKELMELTTYECPYTQHNYTALVPIYIWSKDVEKYFSTSRNNYIKDMACDKERNLRDVELSRFKNCYWVLDILMEHQ